MINNRLSRFIKLSAPLLVLVVVSLFGGHLTVSSGFNSAGTPTIAVEIVPVADLPVSVSEAVLTKTRNGYVLKCAISNNSENQITGLDYALLVIDANNAEKKVVSASESFKLKGYATKTLTSKIFLNLEAGEGYRLFLIPHRVFSSDSVWEVLKANKALEAHASGDYSVSPEVVRALNLLDAPTRSGTIY